MTTTTTATATDRRELHALLAALRDRLEVLAPDIPMELRRLLTGAVGTLEHAAAEQLGAPLLALSLEIHGIVEALLYRSLRQTAEQRVSTIDVARRIERIGTAARWAYVVIAVGELRVGVEAAEQIARDAFQELLLGEPVEGITERMMREWGEEQRAEVAVAAMASASAARSEAS